MKKPDKVHISEEVMSEVLEVLTREFTGEFGTSELLQKVELRAVELLQDKVPDYKELKVTVEWNTSREIGVTAELIDKAVEGFRYTHYRAKDLPFHEAMKALHNGEKVTRSIWGGYWHKSNLVRMDKDGISSKTAIIAELKDGGWAVATPYQEDMLAEDWMIVEKFDKEEGESDC